MPEQKRVFKTKRKLAGGQYIYRGWDDYDEGDVIVGRLMGTRVSKYAKDKDNPDKFDWIVKVETSFLGDKKFQREIEDKDIVMNSAGQLDKGMKQLSNGDLFQVTYNGKQEIKGGTFKGKDAHLHEVEEVYDEDGVGDDDAGLDDEEEIEEDDI